MPFPDPTPKTLAMVLSTLQRVRTRRKDGGISFGAMEYDYFVPLLHAVVKQDAEISPHDRLNLLHEAVSRVAKSDRMTAAGLKRAVRDVVREHLHSKPKDYVLATEISVSRFESIPRHTIRGVTITFTPSLPGRFDRTHALQRRADLPFQGNPEQYTFVRCRCKGRTPYDAAERALGALDLLRGLWNWQLNFGQFQIRIGGVLAPINTVKLGPIHTLHRLNGQPASGFYWYSSSPVSPRRGVHLRDHWTRLRRRTRWARRRLAGIPYGRELEGAFIGYTRALDEWVPDTAFMKLWTVLERLTGSDRESQNKRIRRVAFLYNKSDMELEILTQLKDYRNQMVHEDYSNPVVETYVYQLKRSVEHLLDFHLTLGHHFASLEEAAEFLDLPMDVEQLSGAIRFHRLARRFRTPKR
jgi:hypothetical protein